MKYICNNASLCHRLLVLFVDVKKKKILLCHRIKIKNLYTTIRCIEKTSSLKGKVTGWSIRWKIIFKRDTRFFSTRRRGICLRLIFLEKKKIVCDKNAKKAAIESLWGVSLSVPVYSNDDDELQRTRGTGERAKAPWFRSYFKSDKSRLAAIHHEWGISLSLPFIFLSYIFAPHSLSLHPTTRRTRAAFSPPSFDL